MIQALRRVLPVSLALCALSLLGSAQMPPAAGLDAALDSIQAHKIRSDISFIASDLLGGRDTPSPGQEIAAQFISTRLMRLGFQPGAPDGFLYKYKLAAKELDAKSTKAHAVKAGETIDLAFGRDYAFPSWGICTATTAGNVVFCGEADKDSLAKLDLSGKWALCEDSRTSSRERTSAAKKAGAIGVLVAPSAKGDPEKMASRIQEYAASTQRPDVGLVSDKGEERVVYPYVLVSGPAMGRLLALAGPEFTGEKRPEPGTDLGVVFTDTRKLANLDGTIDVANVCGFWPGNDPKLSREVIIVSAHYDHIGTFPDGTVNNGADDNGSGTTGLLQLAEALSVHGPMRRSILLIWVSGEEKGLWGSQAWCKKPWLPGIGWVDADKKKWKADPTLNPFVCNINIDMIGRNAPNELLITPTKARKDDYNGLTRLAESLCAQEGFPKLGSADSYWTRSDQVNFAQYLGIPVTFLFSDVHEDYHKPTDDPEKIDYDKVRRVTRLVLRMLDGLQADELHLAD